jgi:hypothetical protein
LEVGTFLLLERRAEPRHLLQQHGHLLQLLLVAAESTDGALRVVLALSAVLQGLLQSLGVAMHASNLRAALGQLLLQRQDLRRSCRGR